MTSPEERLIAAIMGISGKIVEGEPGRSEPIEVNTDEIGLVLSQTMENLNEEPEILVIDRVQIRQLVTIFQEYLDDCPVTPEEYEYHARGRRSEYVRATFITGPDKGLRKMLLRRDFDRLQKHGVVRGENVYRPTHLKG